MRYIIGIDLGTTNSCVAFVDTEEIKAPVLSFKIPQLVDEGCIESLPVLPSFCYLASPHEWRQEAICLPWQQQASFLTGSFAQSEGAKVPTRLVQSAKSWLCHAAANRRDKILPIEAVNENVRISPVEATAYYLNHIRQAWNEIMAKGRPDAEFEAQEIVLTVPASFDEVARALTVEAARQAGYVKMTLLEEPQAAFYSWIAQHEGKWQEKLSEGMTILVCDVGGGTTDFSLIETASKNGSLAFQRMAVGDHLLLGGDNMDAAIVRFIEDKLSKKGCHVSAQQSLQLGHEARKAKEYLLGSDKNDFTECYRVLLQGSGSNVVQGSLSTEVSRQELQDLLLQGFFGFYSLAEALNLRKATGFRTMGLPYESEPSIIKHMAHFLVESGAEGEPKKPDFILFNGGSLKPTIFQEAIIRNLKSWFPDKPVKALPSFNLDLAVARGAAYFGKARRGMGIKIGGGLPRSYYLAIDIKDKEGRIEKKALTLVPRGSEEGYFYEPQTTFFLTPNTPVSFQLVTSHSRLHDKAGELVEIDAETMHLLPSIQTILRFGKKQAAEASQEKIPVHLQVRLTEIGTLEIKLKSLKTDHTWELEFQLKSASGQDDSLASLQRRNADQTFSQGYLKNAVECINQAFGPGSTLKPSSLMEKLEESLSLPRKEWPPSLMRGLADVLLKNLAARKKSLEHTARWWNLVGFMLRPGFGFALDDFRIKELWKVILSDFKTALPLEVQIQMWICYRRIAGGLSKGQQMQLANDLVTSILDKKGEVELKGKSELYPYSEKIRAFAAFELIDTSLKTKIGKALVARLCKANAENAEFWALGRLGARHLIYGSLAHVIPRDLIEAWIRQLLHLPLAKDERSAFLLGQLARKTEHRELNLSSECAQSILEYFAQTPYYARLSELLLKENILSQKEQEIAFGEGLPAGLLLETSLQN
jgi:molecular chaperone DnaK (HSP70)